MAESSVFNLLKPQERAEKLLSNGPHRGQAVGVDCVIYTWVNEGETEHCTAMKVN